MRRVWRKFHELPASERALFAQALVLLPLTAVALRLGGLRRWQALLTRFTPATRSSAAKSEKEVFIAACVTSRIVKAACRRGLYGGNCLQRSLVLWWLLGRQNIAAELCFGARKETGRIEAHAWIEVLGLVLNETDDVRERFAAFERPAFERPAFERPVKVAASRLT